MYAQRYSILIAALMAAVIVPCKGEASWGFRDFKSYEEAGRLRWGIAQSLLQTFRWDQIEDENGHYDWAEMDSFINACGGSWDPRIVEIDISSAWATGGVQRPPDDLDFDTDLLDTIPEHGYSESFYTFVRELSRHMQESHDRSFPYCYVLGNRIDLQWNPNAESVDMQIDGYVRCLRTLHKAIADYNEDLHPNGQQYNHFIVWGEFDMVPLLEQKWLRLGEQNADQKDSLLALEQAIHERDGIRIETWDAFSQRDGSPEVDRSVAWAMALAAESGQVDYLNVRYTFKPYFLKEIISVFNWLVEDAGGRPKKWVATTCALELDQGSLTQYSPSLQESDAIKSWFDAFWTTGSLLFEISPAHDNNEERTFGLLDSAGNSTQALFAMKSLNDQYCYFNEPHNLSEGLLKFYRAYALGCEGAPSWDFDYLWLDSPFDTTVDIQHVSLPCQELGWEDWAYIKVVNLAGDTLADIVNDPDRIVAVIAEPTQVVWYLPGYGVGKENPPPPARFALNSLFPNPVNSTFSVDFNLLRPGEYGLKLFSIDGREVFNKRILNAIPGLRREEFSVPGLPSGSYRLVLNDGRNLVGRPLVIVK